MDWQKGNEQVYIAMQLFLCRLMEKAMHSVISGPIPTTVEVPQLSYWGRVWIQQEVMLVNAHITHCQTTKMSTANHVLAGLTPVLGRRNATTIVALSISPQAAQQANQQAAQ